MLKKLALLTLTTVFLGGCSFQNILNTGNAAKDTQSPAPTVTTSPDAQLQAMPSPAKNNDEKSLESDINNTTILDEDFSDLN